MDSLLGYKRVQQKAVLCAIVKGPLQILEGLDELNNYYSTGEV